MQCLPGHQLSGLFQKHGQQAKGLFLQPDASAILGQAASAKIGFETPKPQSPERVVRLRQRNPTLAIAGAFLALQKGDDLPDGFDLIQFSRGPTVH